jgi:putative flippase GtrA
VVRDTVVVAAAEFGELPLRSRWSRLAGEGARYFFASLAALALDWLILVTLVRLAGVSVPTAGALGYLSGMVLAYVLSIRWVFKDRSLRDWQAEFLVFALVGACGLALTELLLWLLSVRATVPVELAKILTAGAVFLFNFVGRKWLLFRDKEDA